MPFKRVERLRFPSTSSPPDTQRRLSVPDDGRYRYATKRGSILVLTAAEFVNRLVALVPPKGKHLTTFDGAFARYSSLRKRVMLPPQSEPPEVLPEVPSGPSILTPTPRSAAATPRLGDLAAAHLRG